MPTLKQRLRAAARALRGQTDYIHATVTGWEAGYESGLRLNQSDYVKLVRRFTKHVKVAASRNASGVAKVPIRVMRRKASGSGGSAFKARLLSLVERKAVAGRFDHICRKVYGDQGDMEEITDPMHPVAALLANANPRDNGFDLIEQVQLGMELTGNGYLYSVMGPNKWPVEIWPMQPQFVRVIPDQDKFISGYIYGRSPELEERFDVKQITHIKFPNPTGDPYYGIGPLASCVDDHDLSMRFTQLAHSMIDNGVQPGGVFMLKGATEPQRKEFEVNANRKWAGADKYGRIMVTTGEAEWFPQNPGEKEMAYLQSAKDVRETIANAFDLPVALLTLDSAALATAKAAIPQWQLMALLPRCMRMQSKLNEQLLPAFREALGDESLCLIFDNVVDRDEAVDSTVAVTEFGGDLITKNEARAIRGYEPVPDGDRFKSDYAAEQAMAQAEQAAALAPDDTKPPPDEKGFHLHPSPAPAEAKSHAGAFQNHSAYWLDDKPHSCCNKVPRGTKAAPQDEAARAREREMQMAMERWFQTLAASIDASMMAGENPSIGADMSVSGPLGRRLVDAIKPAMAHATRAGVQIGVAEVNDQATGAIRFQLPEVQRFIDRNTLQLADSVMQTSEAEIRAAIGDGLAAGKTPYEITANVREVIIDASPARSEAIAVTETNKALNTGRMDAWKAAGRTHKYWLLSGNPCPICVAIAEKFNEVGVEIDVPFLAKGASIQIGKDEKGKPILFTNTYQDVHVPPVHPFCMCDITDSPPEAA